MESREKNVILGILMLSTLAACSGGDDAGPARTADGGLDGGGSIAVGLSWERGVFVQPIWEQGQPRLLVSNRSAEEIAFGVYATEWTVDPEGPDRAPDRGALLSEASVPAHATRSLDGATLVGSAGDLLWVSVDDERLGLLYRPQPPVVTGTLPFISSEPLTQAQVETDFSVLPGASFAATVTLSQPGQLWIQPATSPNAAVEILTATSVSSQDAVVTTTADGFRVELPAETSETSPARVQLSFTLSQGATAGEPLLAFDAGFFCTEPGGESGCNRGTGLLRFVPEP